MQTLDFNKLVSKYGWNTEEYNNVVNDILVNFSFNNFKEKVWLAGGAIRRVIASQPILDKADFDFFFDSGLGFEEFQKKLIGSYQGKVVKETPTNTTIKLQLKSGNEVLFQLIRIAYFRSAETLLDSFDYTICQFAVDLDSVARGNEVLYCGDTSLYDLGRKRLVINKITYPIASLRRMIKYANQGFYVCQGSMTEFLRAVSEHPELIDQDPKYID